MHSYSTRMAPTWWMAAVTLLVSALLGSSTLAGRAEQDKTAKDSVYSAAQAKRGEAFYQDQCAACHSADLSGGEAPALAGADFLGFWDKMPVADLVAKIFTTMPANSPGTLNRQQATDITAFVLQANKFPAGELELGADEAVQKTIAIVK